MYLLTNTILPTSGEATPCPAPAPFLSPEKTANMEDLTSTIVWPHGWYLVSRGRLAFGLAYHHFVFIRHWVTVARISHVVLSEQGPCVLTLVASILIEYLNMMGQGQCSWEVSTVNTGVGVWNPRLIRVQHYDNIQPWSNHGGTNYRNYIHVLPPPPPTHPTTVILTRISQPLFLSIDIV